MSRISHTTTRSRKGRERVASTLLAGLSSRIVTLSEELSRGFPPDKGFNTRKGKSFFLIRMIVPSHPNGLDTNCSKTMASVLMDCRTIGTVQL